MAFVVRGGPKFAGLGVGLAPARKVRRIRSAPRTFPKACATMVAHSKDAQEIAVRFPSNEVIRVLRFWPSIPDFARPGAKPGAELKSDMHLFSASDIGDTLSSLPEEFA